MNNNSQEHSNLENYSNNISQSPQDIHNKELVSPNPNPNLNPKVNPNTNPNTNTSLDPNLEPNPNHNDDEGSEDHGTCMVTNQKCVIHNKKKVQFICFNSQCIKRGKFILCSKCQLENHAGHSNQIVKISKYIDSIQKAKNNLKEDIQDLNIYKVDNISRDKHLILKQLLNTYEKSIFTVCDWYNSYLDFEENAQSLISTDSVSDFAQNVKMMASLVKFDEQSQKITPIEQKFKFNKSDGIHGDLPKDFLTFEQGLYESLQKMNQQLTDILEKHKDLLEKSQQQRELQMEQEQQQQKLEMEKQHQQQQQQQQQYSKHGKDSKPKRKHSGSDYSDSEVDLENSKENSKRKGSYRSLEKNIKDNDDVSESDSNEHKNFQNNQNGPYGFEWATEWVEELPKGWQEMLETKSRTPCIGIIVSKRVKDSNVTMEALQKCVKDNFKVYNRFFKEEVCKKDQMEKLCLLINVRTATTIKAAKVLKKIIKSSFKGYEICVKTWGSRKQVNKFHSDRPYPSDFGGYRGKHGSSEMRGGYHNSSEINRHGNTQNYYKNKSDRPERSRSRENYNKYPESGNKNYYSSAQTRPIGEPYKKKPYNNQY